MNYSIPADNYLFKVTRGIMQLNKVRNTFTTSRHRSGVFITNIKYILHIVLVFLLLLLSS